MLLFDEVFKWWTSSLQQIIIINGLVKANPLWPPSQVSPNHSSSLPADSPALYYQKSLIMSSLHRFLVDLYVAGVHATAEMTLLPSSIILLGEIQV